MAKNMTLALGLALEKKQQQLEEARMRDWEEGETRSGWNWIVANRRA